MEIGQTILKKFNDNFIAKKVQVLVKGKGKKSGQYRGTTKWMQVVNFELSKKAKSIENIKIIINSKPLDK